jgi:hypothetical protein
MALILLGEQETRVAESVEDVLIRIVASKDGLRSSQGTILAPPGWITLRAFDTGEPIYIQAAHVGQVRED